MQYKIYNIKKGECLYFSYCVLTTHSFCFYRFEAEPHVAQACPTHAMWTEVNLEHRLTTLPLSPEWITKSSLHGSKKGQTQSSMYAYVSTLSTKLQPQSIPALMFTVHIRPREFLLPSHQEKYVEAVPLHRSQDTSGISLAISAFLMKEGSKEADGGPRG